MTSPTPTPKRRSISSPLRAIARPFMRSFALRMTLGIAAIVSIVCISAATSAPEPSVGLYYYFATDPTGAPGVSAPLWQLGVQTTDKTIWYKSGSAATSWIKIGGGGTGAGTVTSVACTAGTGVACTPNPITSSGAIAGVTFGAATVGVVPASGGGTTNFLRADGSWATPAGTGVTGSGTAPDLAAWSSSSAIGNYAGSSPAACAAGQADTRPQLSAAGALTSTCAAFVNAVGAGTGLALAGSTVSGVPFGAATNGYTPSSGGGTANFLRADGSWAAPPGTGGSVSGTTNTIGKFTSSTAVGNSGLTDDGTTVTTSEGVSFGGLFAVSGSVTATALSGTTNNWDPQGTGNLSGISRIINSPSSNATVTGLVAGVSGQVISIVNTSTSFTLTFNNLDGGSLAANQFVLPNASAYTIPPGGTLTIRYPTTATAWRPWSSGTQNTTLTANTIPKGVGPNMIGNSSATDDGTTFTQSEAFAMSAAQSDTSVGTQDNFTLTSNITRLVWTGASAVTYDGFTGGVNGRILIIENAAATPPALTLQGEAAGSTAANRITALGGSASNALSGLGSQAILIYEGSTSRWRVIAINSTTFSGALSIGSGLTLNGQFSMISVTSPTALSGTTNDYAPTAAGVYRQDVSSAATVTGLSIGQGNGRIVIFHNIATTAGDTLSFTNEDAGSTAANRFTLPGGVTFVVQTGQSCTFRYDSTSSRWRLIDGRSSQLQTQADTSTGTVNDFALTSGVGILRMSPASAVTLTGLTGGIDGKQLIVQNIGGSGGSVTLTNNSASSTAANRFLLLGGANIVMTDGGSGATTSVILVYDGTSSRWREVARSLSQYNTGLNMVGNLTISATSHLKATGTSPTLSSCGTSPVIVGSDLAGTVTMGATGTGCIVTFAATYTTDPTCVWSAQTSLTYSYVHTATTTTLTAATGASDVFDFICVGH